MTGTTSFSRPEDLLERALVELRATLAGYVETSCGVDAEHRPVPGSCEVECVVPIERLLGLVRDIEAEIGTPADLFASTEAERNRRREWQRAMHARERLRNVPSRQAEQPPSRAADT